MKKDKTFIMEKIPKKVKLGIMFPGGEIFDTTQFSPEKVYEVNGMDKHGWGDGTSTLCYILINDNGILVEKACTRFVVVE